VRRGDGRRRHAVRRRSALHPVDRCLAGVCAGSEEPRAACKQPLTAGASSLALRDAANAAGDIVAWSWRRGAETSTVELGDPTAGTRSRSACTTRPAAFPRSPSTSRPPRRASGRRPRAAFAIAIRSGRTPASTRSC
jgi:hypothetical protein